MHAQCLLLSLTTCLRLGMQGISFCLAPVTLVTGTLLMSVIASHFLLPERSPCVCLQVSLPSTVHMMGVTYDLSPPHAPLIITGRGNAVLGTSQLSSSVGADGKEGAQKQHFAGSATALASSTMSTSSLMGEGSRLFRLDMKSRLWFTYRHSLAPINASGPAITSDSGWGCMLRSAQMMMAQALLVHALGREWRLPDLPFQDLPVVYR